MPSAATVTTAAAVHHDAKRRRRPVTDRTCHFMSFHYLRQSSRSFARGPAVDAAVSCCRWYCPFSLGVRDVAYLAVP